MSEWKECIIANLGEVVGGATPSTKKTENYENGDISWITPKDLSTFRGRYILRGERNITEIGLNSCSTRLLPPNTVLFSSRAPIGYVAIAAKEMCTNQGFKSVIPNTDTDFMFLYYLLKYNRDNIENMGSGTTFKEVSGNTMKSIKVCVPVDIDEQRRIGAVLSAIDDKIELNTAINENLEQQAQALFKAWFVDFEPFGGVMPDDWKIISLGKLCDSISKKHKFNKDELIFLNTGDVENGMILHNNYSEVSQMPGQAKKSIAINDILYSEIRPINKHFAYVNFVADDYVVSTKLMVLRAKGISPRRLYQFLTMPDTLKELQVEAESRSGTFPQIRFDNIQQLEMIVASEQVEKEYSERLNTIYSMIDTNNSENKRLSALRDTLLPKLMNGEIDVSAVKI